nr:tail fiber assembly protein [Candidatus Sodalis pierantonius]
MIDSYKKVGSLPDDLIDIDDKTYAKYCRNPPRGKTRGADSQGYPIWIDAPFMKQRRMDEATRAIAPLQDAVDLDMATDAEKAALLAWKKYRVLLNRVDITQVPDIDWPEAPA